MKANWKTVGILAISAAILYFPARKLYDKLTKKAEEDLDNDATEEDTDKVKAFSPAYRRIHKVHPHHRH